MIPINQQDWFQEIGRRKSEEKSLSPVEDLTRRGLCVILIVRALNDLKVLAGYIVIKLKRL